MERFTEHFLSDPSERPRMLYEYYVTGRGEFPWDMLRYDNCWPADTDSAMLMGPQFGTEVRRNIRSIKMRSYREPTVARWSSFLWAVGTENLGRMDEPSPGSRTVNEDGWGE